MALPQSFDALVTKVRALKEQFTHFHRIAHDVNDGNPADERKPIILLREHVDDLAGRLEPLPLPPGEDSSSDQAEGKADPAEILLLPAITAVSAMAQAGKSHDAAVQLAVWQKSWQTFTEDFFQNIALFHPLNQLDDLQRRPRGSRPFSPKDFQSVRETVDLCVALTNATQKALADTWGELSLLVGAAPATPTIPTDPPQEAAHFPRHPRPIGDAVPIIR